MVFPAALKAPLRGKQKNIVSLWCPSVLISHHHRQSVPLLKSVFNLWMLASAREFSLNGNSHTRPASETKVIWPRASAFPPPPLPSLFDPVLLSSSSSDYKVNAVLLLGPSQPRKESTTQTLTTNYKITPVLPPHPLSHSLFSLFLQAHKHPSFHFAEKTFCHNCCAVRFFFFWARGLPVISRPSHIHWQWQTSVPLTLQSLQFSRVIYGARRTHPPCLLLSAFMMLDSRRGPFTLVPQPSPARWAWHFLRESQSYYPLYSLVVGR